MQSLMIGPRIEASTGPWHGFACCNSNTALAGHVHVAAHKRHRPFSLALGGEAPCPSRSLFFPSEIPVLGPDRHRMYKYLVVAGVGAGGGLVIVPSEE